MVLRGVASPIPLAMVRRRTVVLGAVLALLLASVITVWAADLARGSSDRCERYAADSRDRAADVTGTGARVLVIGDSWSAGLGLARAAGSWPSRLAGTVHVAGFSGSGFSEHASPCGRVSFADRAPAALRGGADLVVVEGGLNDYDQPEAEVRTGFRRLMTLLAGRRVVVVGPASAPSRAAQVPRVDALLAGLAREYGAGYVHTTALRLPYLDDGLHLTAAGHEEFGDFVAGRIAALVD